MDRSREFAHLVHLLDPTSIFPDGGNDIRPSSLGALLGHSTGNSSTPETPLYQPNPGREEGEGNEHEIGLGKEQEKQWQNHFGIGSSDDEENCTEFRKGSNHISIGFRSTQSLLKR